MRVPPRRLTVLASLDVAGYTRLVEADERGTLAELADMRRQVLEPGLEAHSGNLFKMMGDGALIEFISVEDAVRWAIAFQTEMDARNAGRAAPMLIRVGIGLADVFVEGNDRFGAAVGFVVRLQQAAPPGGIAITHSVRWQLAKELAAAFDRTMWVELKGMDEQFEIWLWRMPGQEPVTDPASVGIGHRPIPASPPARPDPVPPPRPPPAPAAAGLDTDHPSIAVLPFGNMSGDPVAGSIADGIVEEVTATLSRVRDFTVIARNSAYAYRGEAKDVRQISRELRVRYILEGSLRKAGNRVRVTAQLIDAVRGTHLWADSYDGVLDNLFDFEDEIAERVVGAIQPSIRAAEIALARGKRPESLAAYDLVLRALPHLWAHRYDDNLEAMRLLDEARRLDPGYARAAALAAWARGQHIVYNWSSDAETMRSEAARLIEDASRHVTDDPMALTAIATACSLVLGDLNRAQFFTDRALALDPNQAWAWTRLGFIRVYRGDPNGAIEAFERARRLSPLDPFSFNSFIGMGLANFALGRYAEAVDLTRRAMHERSGMTWAYRDLAVFLAHAGRIPEARQALAIFVESRPRLTLAGVRSALRFMEPGLLDRYVEGLRLAGLPA
jgi:adenylate cyclase